ncbi:MAG: ABC transporter substrate-binding protein [Clostridia bacterium]|nr:ABC transporter substrate-binding protein [Clostridia bacterium]
MLTGVMLFTFFGCGKKNNTPSVYFLNFKPESAAAYEKIAKEYEKETGIRVKVMTASSGEYESTLKAEMSKSDVPTIFQLNGPVGYTTWEDYCYDLSGTALYGYLSDQSLAIQKDGGVYGIPYVVEGYGIIYNSAITDKYFALDGAKFASMEEIDSFDKLSTLVTDMTAKKEALGIEGVFASTSLAAGNQWRWQTHLLNVPLYYEFATKGDNTTLEALDANEIEFEYEENFKNIFDLYINNSVTQPQLLGSKSVDDSMAEFALGRCAMVQNGNWAWSQISGVSGNTVAEEDIKMLPIYTGIPGEEHQGLCVGTESYIAVNAKAEQKDIDASVAFLEWLFSSETGKSYVTNELGFISPFNTFNDDEKPTDPLAREVLSWLDSGKVSVDWMFAAFPSEGYKDAVGGALLEYSGGNAKWEDVALAVRERWASERQR